MAEVIAKRMWPDTRIRSAGIHVPSEGSGAADEAITVMANIGIDIRSHRATSISNLDTSSYQFILALDKSVKYTLVNKHAIEQSKIIEMFVKDPYDGDLERYIRCAEEIQRKLRAVKFEQA